MHGERRIDRELIRIAAEHGRGEVLAERAESGCPVEDDHVDLKLVEHIIPDIRRALGMKQEEAHYVAHRAPQREDDIVDLWDPKHGPVPGGVGYGLPSADEVPF